ncbi:MAG: hypothetical protein INR65_10910 [Gluconacetobacter diazotrophicus]|nr:hypothetical protein [Gluconacetobacter diazotrophicus]
MELLEDGARRTYRLTTTAELRGHRALEPHVTFSEEPAHAVVRTGNVLFDGLYALAVSEARANAAAQISDGSYDGGRPLRIEAFQTGELWPYVWTRDLAYALDLALAGFDPPRAAGSLLFKASARKATVRGGVDEQIVQDTGSGGSYPVSTDRVVWALGAHATLQALSGPARAEFLAKVYPILRGTAEQDRRLAFDPFEGLYRGEQSFLDWREQTYPGWTKTNVLTVAVSKALSTNAAHYGLLVRAAEYADRLGQSADHARYAAWAGELREAVNHRFWDAESGLYSTYLLSDDGVSDSVRVRRYDLLGAALAILSGLADERQAASILENYPGGPFGPPVVWPQERTVPIYHNQGIWPFVTAYWVRAARQTGHAAAVDAGLRSLMSLAAANLSNMENHDFVSGRNEVKSGPRVGPVVSSRRQLWSVAGYLSSVQDAVFGLEISWDGIRFRPFVTAEMRRGIFADADQIEWRDFACRRARHHVRIHLPPAEGLAQGVCTVARTDLNGQPVGGDFVGDGRLRADNVWDVYLQAPGPGEASAARPLRLVDVHAERSLCAPLPPRWREGGVQPVGGRLELRYEHDDPIHVAFDIYRDGQLCARGLRQTTWTDPDSSDTGRAVRCYRVAAVDVRTGNVSHLTAACSYRAPEQERTIPAASLRHRGGALVDGHHFENWGQPDHELATGPLTVDRTGSYLVHVEFSNGSGPVNTGVTCAVKRLEVQAAGAGEAQAAGYFVMPQSGDWKRFDLSSAVRVELEAGREYVLRLAEDEYCRNMSYLQSNERYTAAAGGGPASYNAVNVAGLRLLYLAAK